MLTLYILDQLNSLDCLINCRNLGQATQGTVIESVLQDINT